MSWMAAWSCHCVATINTQSTASNYRNTEFCLSWQLTISLYLLYSLNEQSTLKTRLSLPLICGGGRLCWFLFEELWNFAPSLVRCGGGGGGGGVATPSALIWIHQPGGIPHHTSQPAWPRPRPPLHSASTHNRDNYLGLDVSKVSFMHFCVDRERDTI